MDDVEETILARAASGKIEPEEAAQIAPLRRFVELHDSGLIDISHVPDHRGETVKVWVKGITTDGRDRMRALKEKRRESSPAARAGSVIARISWILLGVGATLLAQWLSKLLGLSN